MPGDFAAAIFARLGEVSGEWPRVEYQADPVGFARDVMGYTPCRTLDEVKADVVRCREESDRTGAEVKPRILWAKQIEILEKLAKPRARVAVRSGHKVSKSHTDAIAALWFFCSFPDARVVMTAVTARQVDAVLWREVKKVAGGSRTRIEGTIGELARTGFRGTGYREIVGFTAREPEAVAGVSGANILYIVDEASGVPDSLFEAISGNMMGGARMLMTSNPTQTSGTFFEAFHKGREYHACVHISSEDTPNAQSGESLIPGLACRDEIEQSIAERGRDSVYVQIRILGNFVLNEDRRIISFHALEQSIERWKDIAQSETDRVANGNPKSEEEVRKEGRLYIGFDPAGPGSAGDESAFAPRRGNRIFKILRFRGQNEDGLLVQLLGILSDYAVPRDLPPVVVIDRSGPVGIKVARRLAAYLASPGGTNRFELVVVVSSDKSPDPLARCDRVRDLLWWRMSQWVKDGGAIPDEPRLQTELHAPEWFTPPGRDLLKATPKDLLRKALGNQSPDSADAACLSVWESTSHAMQVAGAASSGGTKDVYEAPKEIDAYEVDDGVGGNDPVYG